MKINKLFHWLYALLMLLPIFAIGFTCAYVTFNKNAFESYYGETINQKEVKFLTTSTLKNGETVNLINGTYNAQSGMSVSSNNIYVDDVVSNIGTADYSNVRIIGFYYPNSQISLYFYDDLMNALYTDVRIYNISFTYQGIRQDQNDRLAYVINNNDFLFKYEYNKYSYLDNVFYYSLDEMKNNPLFSWANNNFLTNPFSYLFNLFGVPTDSGIMTLLSYWLDISIIWLVFDLIMYVPLLAHRWIDKGMVD